MHNLGWSFKLPCCRIDNNITYICSWWHQKKGKESLVMNLLVKFFFFPFFCFRLSFAAFNLIVLLFVFVLFFVSYVCSIKHVLFFIFAFFSSSLIFILYLMYCNIVTLFWIRESYVCVITCYFIKHTNGCFLFRVPFCRRDTIVHSINTKYKTMTQTIELINQ